MRGGDRTGSSGDGGSMSTVSKAGTLEQDYVGLSEVSSRPTPVKEDSDEELELGLGLGPVVRPSVRAEYRRFLTAKDFPSMLSSSSSSSPPDGTRRTGIAGVKRAADSAAQEAVSNSPGHVVGWPPIRAYRMNSLVNQRQTSPEDASARNDSNAKSVALSVIKSNEKSVKEKGNAKSLYVKVNMDGIPIGRKVDLNAHTYYESLALALEDMFRGPTSICGSQEHEVQADRKTPSKLLDGSSDFVLTYEDKEGDWMLVGDVPWGMFLNTVRRLRIMRTSDAHGLAPRFQDSSDRQRSKPI